MLWNTIFTNHLRGSICYTDLNEELTRDFEVTITLHLLIMFSLALST